MCVTRKIPHPSLESAQAMVADMKRRGVPPRKRIKALQAYKCPHCPYYHVGHARKRYLKRGHAA